MGPQDAHPGCLGFYRTDGCRALWYKRFTTLYICMFFGSHGYIKGVSQTSAERTRSTPPNVNKFVLISGSHPSDTLVLLERVRWLGVFFFLFMQKGGISILPSLSFFALLDFFLALVGWINEWGMVIMNSWVWPFKLTNGAPVKMVRGKHRRSVEDHGISLGLLSLLLGSPRDADWHVYVHVVVCMVGAGEIG